MEVLLLCERECVSPTPKRCVCKGVVFGVECRPASIEELMKMFVSFDFVCVFGRNWNEATLTEWSPVSSLRVSYSVLSVCVCVSLQ